MIIENVLQTPIILLIKRYAFNYLYIHTHMLEFGFTIFTVSLSCYHSFDQILDYYCWYLCYARQSI